MSSSENPTTKLYPNDVVSRGIYKSNPLGATLFVTLRSLDPLIQYAILRPITGLGTLLLSRLGLSTIANAPAGNFLPLPPAQSILVLLSASAAAKQIYWLLFTSKEEMTAPSALSVAAFNTSSNALNSLMLLATATSATLSPAQIPIPFTDGLTLPAPVVLGTALFYVGIALETIPEVQRRKFKEDPKNKGQVCNVGLWGMARHINYGGYTLWRSGYGMAGGGLVGGVGMAVFQMWHFLTHSVGVMDEYMTGRYAGKWEDHKKRVRWLLLPGIY